MAQPAMTEIDALTKKQEALRRALLIESTGDLEQALFRATLKLASITSPEKRLRETAKEEVRRLVKLAAAHP